MRQKRFDVPNDNNDDDDDVIDCLEQIFSIKSPERIRIKLSHSENEFNKKFITFFIPDMCLLLFKARLFTGR